MSTRSRLLRLLSLSSLPWWALVGYSLLDVVGKALLEVQVVSEIAEFLGGRWGTAVIFVVGTAALSLVVAWPSIAKRFHREAKDPPPDIAERVQLIESKLAGMDTSLTPSKVRDLERRLDNAHARLDLVERVTRAIEDKGLVSRLDILIQYIDQQRGRPL